MKNKHQNMLTLLMISMLTASINAHALTIQQVQSGITFDDLKHNKYQLSLVTPSKKTHMLTLNSRNASVTANSLNVESLEDGTYKFELTPIIDTGSLATDVRILNDNDVTTEFEQQFASSEKHSGTFAIHANRLIAARKEKANRDQVFNDDLITTGSICAGNDCANGESFGFDTLRLKENNLRIKFDDTSTGENNFPSNDWQITINDSDTGGMNKFSIDDITGNRTPFTIEAGAKNNSLYIDSAGKVGIDTNNPVVELHIVDGDSPTLRLEQDGSSGFTPQVFDIASNESNFFIRDVTNGSQLPFRIKPGSNNDDAIVIDANGKVGMGTDSPNSSLHLKNNDGDTAILVEETSNTVADRKMLRLSNKGGVRLDFENTSGGAQANNWRLGTENNTGSFVITEVGSGDIELEITTNGDILARSVVVHSSDVNKKKNIVEVDANSILEKVKNLPISTWQYKDQDRAITHMGPMAQDFRKAFGLGINDTTISDTDIVGVALASIKALQSQLEESQKNNALLEKRIFNLETQLIKKDKVVASN